MLTARRGVPNGNPVATNHQQIAAYFDLGRDQVQCLKPEVFAVRYGEPWAATCPPSPSRQAAHSHHRERDTTL